MGKKVSSETKKHIDFARRLSRWLREAGVERMEAVDFSDIVFGARVVERTLEEMMRLNPWRARDRDRALGHAGVLSAYLFTEIADHLSGLQKDWPELEHQLGLERRKRRRKASSPAPRQRTAIKEAKRKKSAE